MEKKSEDAMKARLTLRRPATWHQPLYSWI